MIRAIALALLTAFTLAACNQTTMPYDPAWERDDPARRVYGGGV